MNRRPLGARRDHAERYLLVTIVAFAVTVAGVRWYLDVAGYPTVGGGGLHVAHVLWGGLALLLAALLPMLFVGRRALMLSALLAGIGTGLFIDEVGKFLTTSNDYFFAPAAPIIYGGVLLMILVWLVVRRRSANRHDATQALVEAVRNGIDGRLTEHDRRGAVEMWEHTNADASGRQDLLDAQLLAMLSSPEMDAHLASPGWVASGKARALLERLLPTRLERWVIIAGLLWATGAAIVVAMILLFIDSDDLAGELAQMSTEAGRLEIPTEPVWIILLFVISLGVGIGSFIAVVTMWAGRIRQGLTIALGAILAQLVAGGLVSFYAVQLGALSSTVLGLAVLGLILDQRIRLDRAEADAAGVDANSD